MRVVLSTYLSIPRDPADRHLHRLLTMKGVQFQNVGHMCMEIREPTDAEAKALESGTSLKAIALRKSRALPPLLTYMEAVFN